MTQSTSQLFQSNQDTSDYRRGNRSRIKKKVASWLTPQTKELFFEFGNLWTHIYDDQKKLISINTCYLQENFSQELVTFGKEAFSLLGKSPAGMSVVFPIKKNCIYDLGQFEQFLSSLLSLMRSRESWNWLTRIKAVCIISDSCTNLDRQLYTQTFQKVGITDINFKRKSADLLEKITGCSSFSIENSKTEESQIVILDIGDQVSELVIGSLRKVSFWKSLDFGGAQITNSIMQYLKVHHELQVSYQQAIEIKHQLPVIEKITKSSSTAQLPELGSINIRGVDLSEGLIVTKKIQLQSIIEVVYQQLPSLLHQIKKTFMKVKSQQLLFALENGIVLSGGGARLAGLADYLSNELSINVCMSSKKF